MAGEFFTAVPFLLFAGLFLFYGPITVAIVARSVAKSADAESRLLEAKNEARRLSLEERRQRRTALATTQGRETGGGVDG